MRICTWNCDGWFQKLDLNHVTDVLQSFDIFSLNETFVDNEKYEYGAYKDYDVYVAKAVKLTIGGSEEVRGCISFC